jgi:hypothetical protein
MIGAQAMVYKRFKRKTAPAAKWSDSPFKVGALGIGCFFAALWLVGVVNSRGPSSGGDIEQLRNELNRGVQQERAAYERAGFRSNSDGFWHR